MVSNLLFILCLAGLIILPIAIFAQQDIDKFPSCDDEKCQKILIAEMNDSQIIGSMDLSHKLFQHLNVK